MQAARLLRRAPEKTRLWAMMETPMAMLSASSIAAIAADSTSRLEALVLGLNDLAKETRGRLTPGRAAFTSWLAVCVAAARAHGCDVIDGVYNDIKDLAGFRAECKQGLDFGFDGKTLIHPSQIDICNEVFAPSAHEIAHARAVIEAFDKPENAGKGVLQIDGKMVELLHAQMAGRTLAIAEAIARQAAEGAVAEVGEFEYVDLAEVKQTPIYNRDCERREAIHAGAGRHGIKHIRPGGAGPWRAPTLALRSALDGLASLAMTVGESL
jgi:citrate lyase subunit beta/citryl-CoA lyase